jgi:ribonuclease BN (tRNA processing enzyme)
MQIEVLGCFGGESPECRLTSLLLDERVALDAGCLSRALAVERQLSVRSVVLSHSHLDHIGCLPFFLDNLMARVEHTVDVYGSADTIFAVRRNLFNAATWADFSMLPNHLVPVMRFHEIKDEVPFEIEGLRFTPISVNHVVPTFGFLIEDERGAVLWSSDTGPTERLWQVGSRATERLRAALVEVSFESELQQIADDSKHLTPTTLRAELAKLDSGAPVLLHHLKPASRERIGREVAEFDRTGLNLLEQGATYRW